MPIILSKRPGGAGGGGAPSGPAGGSLTGTYPDPGIANDAVDTAQIADDAVTADQIDGADAADILAVLGVGQWSSYVPALTASVTDPTLGSGSAQTGRWCRIGNVGFAYVRIAFGSSGTNAGSGEYRIGLPFTVGASQVAGAGSGGLIYDQSVNDSFVVNCRPAAGQAYSTLLTANSANFTTVTHAAPFAWTSNDEIQILIIVEIEV